MIEEDLIVWTEHLTRFGLSEFEHFQLHAIFKRLSWARYDSDATGW